MNTSEQNVVTVMNVDELVVVIEVVKGRNCQRKSANTEDIM